MHQDKLGERLTPTWSRELEIELVEKCAVLAILGMSELWIVECLSKRLTVWKQSIGKPFLCIKSKHTLC